MLLFLTMILGNAVVNDAFAVKVAVTAACGTLQGIVLRISWDKLDATVVGDAAKGGFMVALALTEHHHLIEICYGW